MFTPMVFSTSGGMSDECHQALQRVAGNIANRRKKICLCNETPIHYDKNIPFEKLPSVCQEDRRSFKRDWETLIISNFIYLHQSDDRDIGFYLFFTEVVTRTSVF